MPKKVLYVIGGIFAFIIVIVIISPHPATTPSSQTNQEQKGSEVGGVAKTNEPNIELTEPLNLADKPEVAAKASEPQVSKVTETKTNQTNEKSAATVTTPQYTYYSVVSVVDGDTLKINLNGTTETLRLIGIDTPETVDPRKPVQCFGKEASNKAKELLSGKKVRIEKDSTQGERDKYGRLLAYIYREDGLFYNKYIIEQGYAHEYTYNLPYKYQAEFKAAEKFARENQLGLWSPNTCNGNTTKSASGTTTTQTATTTNQTAGKYYTSSYASSKYYYPAACSAWQSLSSSYLKAFDSLEALLVVYPSRTLSPQCQ